jgi:hypothetical protein
VTRTRCLVFGSLGCATLPMLVTSAASSEELRPLSTDRPDTTESARTVDAGHFQLEMDVARLAVDEGQTGLSFVASNLKLGLTHCWDVQLVIEPLVGHEALPNYGFGYGDTIFRTKLNLFGNDEDTALAVMPWVKFPTAGKRGNDAVEGGLIVPLGFTLPLDFSGSVMAEGDVMADEAGEGRHFELLTSASIGHQLFGPVAAFIEIAGVYSTEADAGYVLFVDGGPVVLVTDHVQLDAAAGVGLTDAADDFSVFTGVSFKL